MAKEDATDEELTHVLRQVGLEQLVENDEGLNAWMGDGGRQLSGGEQRRLGLARAILHNAPLILLDEPMKVLMQIQSNRSSRYYSNIAKASGINDHPPAFWVR